MTYSDMTDDQLATAARRHARESNEGGEGYNPYHEELARRQAAAQAVRPLSRGERMGRLLDQIDRLDCSLARESGTYDAAKVEALRAEYKALAAEADAEFLGVWTRDETIARRAAWNAWVLANSQNGQVASAAIAKQVATQGWSTNDLQRAMRLHDIKRGS